MLHVQRHATWQDKIFDMVLHRPCQIFSWNLHAHLQHFFFSQVAPDTFLSPCDCPNIWVGETFKRDLERSTITHHLCLLWRERNKSEERFLRRAENIWSPEKHLKLPWLKSHFFARAMTERHLKTPRLRKTHWHIGIIQLNSLFLLDKGKHRCNLAQVRLRLWCLFGLRITRHLNN